MNKGVRNLSMLLVINRTLEFQPPLFQSPPYHSPKACSRGRQSWATSWPRGAADEKETENILERNIEITTLT